jgi:pyruvate,water dikinase
MWPWQRNKRPPLKAASAVQRRISQKYRTFRGLLTLNNECLELMAGLQEDLQYAPPIREVAGERIAAVFDQTERVVASLERLTGSGHGRLRQALAFQRREVERHIATLDDPHKARLVAPLAEIHASSAGEAGRKAADLGEAKNKIGLPVPDGFVLTTEAYRRFCGIRMWTVIRDSLRDLDIDNPASLAHASEKLTSLAMSCPMPASVEEALRNHALDPRWSGNGLAVRSSGVGEGEQRTYAGQFLSLLNVPAEEIVQAYRRVVAARFSERALFYRLSAGTPEVDSPLAVLVLPMIPARASGILYTRDPADPKSKELWITATDEMGIETDGGCVPADLLVVSRKRPHKLLGRAPAARQDEIVVRAGGTPARTGVDHPSGAASLSAVEIVKLSELALAIEDHFGCPQDMEWVVDKQGKVWVLQTRPLAPACGVGSGPKDQPDREPVLSGGRAIYMGRAAGPAFLAGDSEALGHVPEGAVVFVRRASPEIVRALPRAAGLVAEVGNVAGHAAALLREFKVPSVFLMPGAFARLKNGDPVSLDAGAARVYAGTLWPVPARRTLSLEKRRQRRTDPVARSVLALNLLDPLASNFRPSGCKSVHDVLRFCHEKAVEAMFEVSDLGLEYGDAARKLLTKLPFDLRVLDLGGGLAPHDDQAEAIDPSVVVSRPFQSLWRGITHPGVTWVRRMPASLGDLASVMTSSIAPHGRSRPLGERSYVSVAEEYVNLNARLAYHFTLVDACLTDTPSNNYISFRFSGGGAEHYRRNLRACFVQECLKHHGFKTDRRGDLVNGWFKKAPAAEIDSRLDMLGRLMVSTSQLDMYMKSYKVMKWYVQQFLEGNYQFRKPATHH